MTKFWTFICKLVHIWPYTWSYATLYSTLHAMMCCHTNKSNLRPFSRPLLSTCIFSYFFGRFYLNFTFSFSPPYFSVILVFRCFWDIFFFFGSVLFYILPRENRDARNLLTNDKRKKKKKKRKKETPELDTSTSTVSLCFFQLRIWPPWNPISHITMCKNKDN